MNNDMSINTLINIIMNIDVTPHPTTPCRGRPQKGPGGGAWGGGGAGVGWGGSNIHIDINMNIDIHIIINMNIEDCMKFYTLLITY